MGRGYTYDTVIFPSSYAATNRLANNSANKTFKTSILMDPKGQASPNRCIQMEIRITCMRLSNVGWRAVVTGQRYFKWFISSFTDDKIYAISFFGCVFNTFECRIFCTRKWMHSASRRIDRIIELCQPFAIRTRNSSRSQICRRFRVSAPTCLGVFSNLPIHCCLSFI